MTLWDDLIRQARESVEFKTISLSTTIALRVFDRLREAKLSQSALAERLGVSRAYVSQILNGKPNMTLETLVKLADALDMRVEIDLRAASLPAIVPVAQTETASHQEEHGGPCPCEASTAIEDATEYRVGMPIGRSRKPQSVAVA